MHSFLPLSVSVSEFVTSTASFAIFICQHHHHRTKDPTTPSLPSSFSKPILMIWRQSVAAAGASSPVTTLTCLHHQLQQHSLMIDCLSACAFNCTFSSFLSRLILLASNSMTIGRMASLVVVVVNIEQTWHCLFVCWTVCLLVKVALLLLLCCVLHMDCRALAFCHF